MKKIVLMIALALSTVVGLQAQNWNIPKGSYSCKIVSINDAHWNPIIYFSKEEQNSNIAGFVLDDEKIVDAAGLVFTSSGTNEEGTNNFIAVDYTNAIYIPKVSKTSTGIYKIGLGHVDNNKVVRMTMDCKKR